MQIRPTDAYAAFSLLTSAVQRKPAVALADSAGSSAASASSAGQASISSAARSRLAAESGETGSATAVYDTDQGAKSLDIDAYFTPPAGGYLTLPPLLLPSQRNIDALSSHISSALPQVLAENGIPSAPASIAYDDQGKMQLPADYPHADKFRQALEKNPALDRELRTVNALASHRVEIGKSMSFQQEYAAASSAAEAAAVVARHAHLFSGGRLASSIALEFSAGGRLTVTADGKAIS
ncbi:MAG: hypothetical protein OEL88_04030 [Sterolibacteriaceae bacterium MAG5]|nr:hypothetical protein [Candidatus Nitricoxidireducens bremensis]